MSVRGRLSGAWPVTIGIHVVQCLFAACFALPFVASVSVPEVLVRPQVAEWLALLRMGEELDHGARRALLPLLAAALNYPWLSVAWLRALDREEAFSEHARFALGRYRAAALTALASALALGLIALVCGASVWALGQVATAALDARTRDLLRCLCLLAGACAALWAVTAQDAAYAAVSGEVRGARAIVRAALAGATARLVAQRGGLVLLQLGIAACSWALPRFTLGANTAADFAVLVATQSCAFLITCSRALWLAWVLERRRSTFGWRKREG